MSGALMMFIILCGFSHFCWIWLLKSVMEVTKLVDEWLRVTVHQKKRVATNTCTEIVTWRTDNGPDFPQSYTDLLADNSIDHQRTASGTSQHNPAAESWLNVVQRRARTQLVWAHAPRKWWGEAFGRYLGEILGVS